MAQSRRGNDVFVTSEPGQSKHWQVTHRGAVLFMGFVKQRDAIRYGRGAAIELQTELCICNRKGQIRRKVSYGPDDPTRKG